MHSNFLIRSPRDRSQGIGAWTRPVDDEFRIPNISPSNGANRRKTEAMGQL